MCLKKFTTQPPMIIIPPPTRSVNRGILFYNRSFFLSFFLSPSNLLGRSTDRQPLYLRRSDRGVILKIWSKIWGQPPLKFEDPNPSNLINFYARQRSYSAYMPWKFHLSVCPSVTRVDQSKTVEARITQFSPYSSPIPLVFRG